KPGQKFSYTSSGYFLLGLMIQRVTGQSLARFAHDNVFKPLGMNSTYYEDDPTAVVKNRVVGYDAKSDGGFRRWMMTSGTVGGWGLKSTVEDLYRWDQNFYRNKLPEGRYLQEFLRSGTLLGNRNVLDLDPVERYRGLRRMAFTGGMPGFAAAMIRFPDEKFAVICLANDSFVAPWTVAREVADLYLADKFTEPSPHKKVDPKSFEFLELPERELTGKPGVYRMIHGRIWKVALREAGLTVPVHLHGTWRLRALSPTRFRVPDSPIDKS